MPIGKEDSFSFVFGGFSETSGSSGAVSACGTIGGCSINLNSSKLRLRSFALVVMLRVACGGNKVLWYP